MLRPICLAFYTFLFSCSASYLASDEPKFDRSRLEATELATGLNRPMELDVAGDGRVFFIELDGQLKVYHPDKEAASLAAVHAEQHDRGSASRR